MQSGILYSRANKFDISKPVLILLQQFDIFVLGHNNVVYLSVYFLHPYFSLRTCRFLKDWFFYTFWRMGFVFFGR